MEACEIELKFDVSDDDVAKLGEHSAFAAPAQTSRLRSTYFDTPTCALQSHFLGLRIRDGGGSRVQTLKWQKPTSPLQRREWETAVAGKRPDYAALAKTPAAEVLADADELAPIFTTTVERSQRLWVRGEDVVELSLDRGKITAGNRSEPIHEIELELKIGEPQALFALAAELVEHANLRLLFASKAARGYRLAADQAEAPQRAEIGGIAAPTPVADGFRDVAWGCLAQIASNAELLRRRRSLEALHQTRVGLRRFRAALSAFRPMIDDREFEDLKTETKWLAGELDAARDLDVFIHESFRSIKAENEDRGAFSRLGARLLHAQTDAYSRAITALDSPRFPHLMLKSSAWLNAGEWLRSEEPVLKTLRDRRSDDFARERLDRARRQIVKRGRKIASLDAPSRHRLRIKAKKLRYAAEFFADSFDHPQRRKRFLAALGDLQDGLGQLNDAAVAHRLALEQVRGETGEAGFAAGLVVAARHAASGKAGKRAVKAFADFDDAQPFWR